MIDVTNQLDYVSFIVKILYLITLLLTLLSALPANSQTEFNKKEISRKVKKLIKEFSNKDVFQIPFNEQGWKTVQYANYLKLEEIATEGEFLVLTNHSSPIIKCYSYYGLLRNYFETKSWKRALERNLCDFTKIKKQSGCIIFTTHVNQLMFELTSKRTGINEMEIMKRMNYPMNCTENP